MAGQEGGRPGSAPGSQQEDGSIDVEMQAGPGASRADLLSHRHPASADAAAGGAAAGEAGGSDQPAAAAPPPRQDSKGLNTSEADSEEAAEVKPASYLEIAWHFGLLGWTAFGGPAAHVNMFLRVRCAAHAVLGGLPSLACCSRI